MRLHGRLEHREPRFARSCASTRRESDYFSRQGRCRAPSAAGPADGPEVSTSGVTSNAEEPIAGLVAVASTIRRRPRGVAAARANETAPASAANTASATSRALMPSTAGSRCSTRATSSPRPRGERVAKRRLAPGDLGQQQGQRTCASRSGRLDLREIAIDQRTGEFGWRRRRRALRSAGRSCAPRRRSALRVPALPSTRSGRRSRRRSVRPGA